MSPVSISSSSVIIVVAAWSRGDYQVPSCFLGQWNRSCTLSVGIFDIDVKLLDS